MRSWCFESSRLHRRVRGSCTICTQQGFRSPEPASLAIMRVRIHPMLKLLAFLFACTAFVADVSAQQGILILDRAPFRGVGPIPWPGQTDRCLYRRRFRCRRREGRLGHRSHSSLGCRRSQGAIAPRPRWSRQENQPSRWDRARSTQTRQPPGADCDCHNLPVLKSTSIEPGSVTAGNRDVEIASGPQIHGSPTWQIDFNDLRWSVPGGTRIQFGVFAEPNSGYTWYNLATPSTPPSDSASFPVPENSREPSRHRPGSNQRAGLGTPARANLHPSNRPEDAGNFMERAFSWRRASRSRQPSLRPSPSRAGKHGNKETSSIAASQLWLCSSNRPRVESHR